MNKHEFIGQLARKAKLSNKEAKVALENTLDLITSSLKKGQKVTFTGFGTYEAVHRKASRKFNPQTKRPIQVPAKTVAKFRAGKNLKEALGKKR